MNSIFDDLRVWAKKHKVRELRSANNEQLRTLKYLNLGNRGLTKLPNSISALEQLEELYIQDNKLTTLPTGLGLLPCLETLAMHGNSITEESENNFYDEIAQGDLGLIRQHFAKYFSYWSALLPREKIKHRKRGEVGNLDEGWPLDIRFLFGKNDQGLFLDYHFEDRRAGESHNRIYENGEVQGLETINPYRLSAKDPEEDKRLQDEYIAENDRIDKILKQKGFSSY